MSAKRPEESTTEFTIRRILDEEAEACAKIAEAIAADLRAKGLVGDVLALAQKRIRDRITVRAAETRT